MILVEGEMDRLRIMTTDLNSYPMDDIKTEPHILIKQECQQSQQSFFVKSEIQDYDEVNILPAHTPPTPPEDVSLPVVGSNTKYISGSSTPQTPVYECSLYVRGEVSMIEKVEFFTNPNCPNPSYTKDYPPFEMTERITQNKEVTVRLFFKTDASFCPTVRLPVKVDSTNSGYIHGGVEVPVEIPGSQQNEMKDKKIAEIAKWLEQDKMDDTSPILNQDIKQEPMQTIFLQNTPTINAAPSNTTMHTITGTNGALWKTSSAPASPLSQVTTPIDNTRTRSASSSPTARSQTVLPNPCCRIQHSSFPSQDDNVPSVRPIVEGEPTYKRRPGPINLIPANPPKFTPISVADNRTILHTINSIPSDRVHTDQISTIGIESLPTITLSEQPQQPQQIFLTSQNVSPKVSQVRIINDAVPTIHSTSLKPEFFVTRTNDVDSNTTEITVGPPQTITQDNDHLRNQRSGRKCRKVYGVSNRSMWCTACRWKKACRRFPSLFTQVPEPSLEELPKVELHAHLNGSLSQNTICKLAELKGCRPPDFQIKEGEAIDLENVFDVFKAVQELTDSAEAVELAAFLTAREFAEDGVKYLESTPRGKWYVEAVLRGIEKAEQGHPKIQVRFLLSIDRARGVEHVQAVLRLLDEFSTHKYVVGIDVSGNPAKGADAQDAIVKCLEEVKAGGRFKGIAAHLGESEDSLLDAESLLRLTDRIGHGTFIVGDSKLMDLARDKPFELCLTSNIINRTRDSYETHHFGDLFKLNHPLCICTDDKGLFGASLSDEYRNIERAFKLGKKTLFDISKKAIEKRVAKDFINLSS
ncbi:Oidioi.mRNA.OKI2018_I69.PAR.g13135.t1.cds [Oikopleura dioica]|uniref:Oidioi.mRNA.OKI2018_I69.PAR.g13135.t1.cds n=1 Tax=Oikopleura dioica TaxID=34765 RepID=A0ABN7S6R2_OIKDI|nr:Oidioi.mRNA.OKI2018_I69.PAR.g13135.t1.cds [Oikopleura dioica]